MFLALLAGGVFVAIHNWRHDPSQRTATHVGTWVVRMLVGCMWFEGMLWKLPLPASPGLRYWTEQMGMRAAFELHREVVTGFLPPSVARSGPFARLPAVTS